MYGSLILAAFENARERPGAKKYTVAKDLSVLLQEQFKVVIGERMLVNYYDAAIRDLNAEFEVRREIVQALCEYLGYSDYREFVEDHSQNNQSVRDKGKEKGTNRGRRWFRIAIWALITLLAVFAVLAIYRLGIGGTEVMRMMVWKGDHYEAAALDLEKYGLKELKYYKEDLIENLRKVTPDCTYVFFDSDGQELLWYGKNKKGELEYFTALARHPETGKTLKAITPYMIRKYICEAY